MMVISNLAPAAPRKGVAATEVPASRVVIQCLQPMHTKRHLQKHMMAAVGYYHCCGRS